MARSLKKGPFIEKSLIDKANKATESNSRAIIKTYSRRSVILPIFIGLTFGVYNGKSFIPVQVSENMIGHKFGEFAPTRTFKGHGADKKTKK